ncbi:hypothetical protein B0T26DRAFT_724547 [Lasiosphaeria miniovina]|uniref:WW domain-containing protein n=1 Tax=Lasiosphaeria miniovina TaxID=1954250 RepID=A0AA40A6U6_9PEZI|nr:uncharacterized protein B0T26DRAFT_724547 [Lasiosphaeria miniovina]KAK0710310.1 hypothetical protein B0T26DRAFT_724547 [Lasiosphaeria miniovina]
MLKSTYTLSPGILQPLPPGWTEHKAPTGHAYYYNAETKESTYKRPGVGPSSAPLTGPQQPAFPQINLSDPAVANAFLAQQRAQEHQQQHGQRGGSNGGGRGGFQSRPRPQPHDRPRSKIAIPGHEPWILVYTKYGRRFAYNPTKNASYWRIPEKFMPAILELDQARILQKATGKSTEDQIKNTSDAATAIGPTQAPARDEQEQEASHDYDSSEYEEVEVTDDEGGDDEDPDGNRSKRQRTADPRGADGPVEFTEDDIAAQLAAMAADYDEEMSDGGGDGGWEGDEGLTLSDEDARELFKDLLNDFNINPYSPWEKLIEEGKIFDDARYPILGTTKARKDVWEEWSRVKIQELKERRAKEEKKDPRIPYIAFLQEKATPKLYWPEFRRKYKKEDEMKDAKLADKDREKMYREHINRLKLPQATLKADLKKLLESLPLSVLNNRTMVSHLPPQVLSDIRFISLDPKTRDAFIEGYLQGLGSPPEGADVAEEEEAGGAKKAREERQKREKALHDRERAVAEEKQRQEKRLQYERARLRDEERELERAMQVGKKGLQSQLATDQPAPPLAAPPPGE